jgi:membrane associated rhomboid family serine protease
MTSETVVVATVRRQRDADERLLVLQSQGLRAAARRERDGWAVLVGGSDAEAARALLEAWERENRSEPERAPPPPEAPFPWLAMAALSAALLGFFAVTGPRADGSAWFAAGSARASRILLGEWWRTVTALTLHADSGHVLGNVLAGSLFAGAVCRRFGSGVGLALLLAAGALGNGANAWLHASGHDSVGASTAVFAAVGALAADALARGHVPRGGRLAPLGAGLGILAMLGTSERADLWAHAFGLLAGLGLGLAAARALPSPPGRAWQVVLGLLASGTIVGAWWLALAA